MAQLQVTEARWLEDSLCSQEGRSTGLYSQPGSVPWILQEPVEAFCSCQLLWVGIQAGRHPKMQWTVQWGGGSRSCPAGEPVCPGYLSLRVYPNFVSVALQRASQMAFCGASVFKEPRNESLSDHIIFTCFIF